MNIKVVLGTIVAIVVVLIIILVVAADQDLIDNDVIDNNNDAINNDVDNGVEEVLARLPREVTVGEKTATLDTETVPQTSRDEYSVVDLFEDVRPDEDPVDYIERHLEEVLSLDHIQEQNDNLFQYSASFYPLEGDQGIISYIRVMNIPDDSVGGGEARFDFIIENGSWGIDWYGERVFCRRPDAEFWQPADQLCP